MWLMAQRDGNILTYANEIKWSKTVKKGMQVFFGAIKEECQ